MCVKEIADSDIFVPRKKIAHRKIAGQTVIVDPNRFKVLRLNETGSFIWDRLDGRCVSELVRCVMDNYEVEKAVASQGAIQILIELDSRLIVERLNPK